MGPGYSIGAVIHLRYAAQPFILWDYVPVKFKCAGDVALCGALDTIVRHRSREIRVHRIFINERG